MRDIGIRIQRYKLSRYRPPDALTERSRLWLTLGLAGWLIWALFLSDHSAMRLIGLGNKKAAAEDKLAATLHDVKGAEKDLRVSGDPEVGAQVLRERHNFAQPGERLYRLGADGSVRTYEGIAPLDSSAR
jgi:hypothetical protein